MKLINDLKALGVTLSDEKIVAKLTDLGLQNSDLSDSEVKELAGSMGAGKLAIASESQIAAPTKTTKGRKSKAIAPAEDKAKAQSARIPGLNMKLIEQSARSGFDHDDAAAAGQAFAAGFQARFAAEAAAGVAALTSNLGSFGRTDSDEVGTALQSIADDWTVESESPTLFFWE